MRISDWSSDVCSSDLQTVERRLCAQFLTIWLFVVCNQHSRRKEAVADAITLAGPCHPIIDDVGAGCPGRTDLRSEEHTSELQSLMRISYAVFCLKKNNKEYIATGKPLHQIPIYSQYNRR